MKKIRLVTKCFLAAGIATTLLTFSSGVSAGGFQLFEQNAVDMGDFGAGGAALAEDASTAYFNPAGLIRINHQQLVISGDEVITDTQFSGTNTWTTRAPLLPPGFAFTQSGSGVQAGGANFVPAIHYVAPISDCFAFGFSVASPFGLETNYPETSVLRYSATKTDLTTIDISPSLAWKLTNKFSIGAGFDATHLDVDFDSIAGLPVVPGNPEAFDTLSKNSASAWGYGWHGGLLYQFDPGTRVGLAYHSQLSFNPEGKSKFVGPLASRVTPGGILISPNLSAQVTLPPWTELSAYHDINCQWAVESSIIYTQWNYFNKNLILKGVQAVTVDPTTGMFIPAQINAVVPENFHNTWRFAVGGNYRPIKPLLLRAGVGFDQTPVNNTDRNARLADSNRYAVAVGAHYQLAKPVGIDVGWTHLFFKRTNINVATVTGLQVSTANGNYQNHADLLGAQLTWDIT